MSNQFGPDNHMTLTGSLVPSFWTLFAGTFPSSCITGPLVPYMIFHTSPLLFFQHNFLRFLLSKQADFSHSGSPCLPTWHDRKQNIASPAVKPFEVSVPFLTGTSFPSRPSFVLLCSKAIPQVLVCFNDAFACWTSYAFASWSFLDCFALAFPSATSPAPRAYGFQPRWPFAFLAETGSDNHFVVHCHSLSN